MLGNYGKDSWFHSIHKFAFYGKQGLHYTSSNPSDRHKLFLAFVFTASALVNKHEPKEYTRDRNLEIEFCLWTVLVFILSHFLTYICSFCELLPHISESFERICMLPPPTLRIFKNFKKS